jgi:hypothetical protein
VLPKVFRNIYPERPLRVRIKNHREDRQRVLSPVLEMIAIRLEHVLIRRNAVGVARLNLKRDTTTGGIFFNDKLNVGVIAKVVVKIDFLERRVMTLHNRPDEVYSCAACGLCALPYCRHGGIQSLTSL